MFKKKIAASTLFLLAFSLPALAEEQGGIGYMRGTNDGDSHQELVFEDVTVGIARGYRGAAAYWDGHDRLEIGSGLGLAIKGRGGASYSLFPNSPITPVLGIEPFNFDLTLSTIDSNKDYIAIQPQIAGGLRLNTDVCRALALVHTGGSLDSLEEDNWHGSTGVAGTVTCPGFHVSADATRIRTASPTDIAHADGYIALTSDTAIGLRGEWLRQSDDKGSLPSLDGETSRSEKRGMIMIRSAF